MFQEVRQAILPLALRNLKRRGDLERAGLLIESLAKHWRDSKPFELLIVAPAVDTQLLRTNLPRFPNIEVSVRPESDFYSRLSTFYMITGWYRQQIVKLEIPVKLGWRGYLTLDSDVCCVGDFDSRTFVDEGRGLSRWEPKLVHQWWRTVTDIVGTTYDSRGHGLSVTPNLLHGDLSAQALDYMRRAWHGSSTAALVSQKVRHPWKVPWTEYSLYTSVAELKGNLFDYHVEWNTCYGSDVHLFSEQSCVWGANDFERMVALPNGSDPGGTFIIVQSHARIPLERVREYALSFAG